MNHQNFRLKSKFTWTWTYNPSDSVAPQNTSPTMRKLSDDKDTRTVSVSTRYVPKCQNSSCKALTHGQDNNNKPCEYITNICEKGFHVNFQRYTDKERQSIVSTANIIFPNSACICEIPTEKTSAPAGEKLISKESAESASTPKGTSNISDDRVSDKTQTEVLNVSDKVTQSTCRECIDEIINRLPSTEDTVSVSALSQQTIPQKSGSALTISQQIVPQKPESASTGSQQIVSQKSVSAAVSQHSENSTSIMHQPYGVPAVQHYYRPPCSCGRCPGQMYAYVEASYPSHCINPACPSHSQYRKYLLVNILIISMVSALLHNCQKCFFLKISGSVSQKQNPYSHCVKP